MALRIFKTYRKVYFTCLFVCLSSSVRQQVDSSPSCAVQRCHHIKMVPSCFSSSTVARWLSVLPYGRRSRADFQHRGTFCVESACSPPCLCACPLGAPVSPTKQQSYKVKMQRTNFTAPHKAYVANKVSSSSSSLSMRKRDTQDRAQQHWQDIKSHIQLMTHPSMFKIDSVQFIQFFRLTNIDCLCISIQFPPHSVLLYGMALLICIEQIKGSRQSTLPSVEAACH